ncbi:hypothetical protein GWK47_019092 [Chionoecetes opilio]|uniref:Uncharacterized protein n=1 Tax=Chionoecetes opilio TaxID=41210 RepID=A0A8J4XUI4_CHIOP|nr:hypothetical protein GWK47_019092 [Chionoecetes opilio]
MSCSASHTRMEGSHLARALRLVELRPPIPLQTHQPIRAVRVHSITGNTAGCRGACGIPQRHKCRGSATTAGLRQPRESAREARDQIPVGLQWSARFPVPASTNAPFAGRVPGMWNIFTAAVPHIQEMKHTTCKSWRKSVETVGSPPC